MASTAGPSPVGGGLHRADFGVCVLGADRASTGPRHGAVQSRVLDMLDEIAASGDAEAWMRQALAGRRRILGFGHAVYRVLDPWAPVVLRELTARIAPERHAVAVQAEAAAATVLAWWADRPQRRPLLAGPARGLRHTVRSVHGDLRHGPGGWLVRPHPRAGGRAQVIRPGAYDAGPPPELG